MKKSFVLCSVLLMLIAVFCFAGCGNNDNTETERWIETHIYNGENKPVFTDNTNIYRLNAGEIYYFDLTGGIKGQNGATNGQQVMYWDNLTYNAEEVEIVKKETSHMYLLKGLKTGSALIQYNDADMQQSVENVNYVNIFIIFS